MDTTIRKHLEKHYKSKGWGESPREKELIEMLRDANTVWTGIYDEHRWWIEYRRVVEIDGILIGYIDALTTGDENPDEKGFEIDQDTICVMQMKKELITLTTYEVKHLE